MNSLDDPIHPNTELAKEHFGSAEGYMGLTGREHAAILLRVPASGNPELDAMIRKALRQEFAKAAMQGMLSQSNAIASQYSVKMADSLLVALAKEGKL